MINKVSEITAQDVANYIHVVIDNETDKSELDTYLNVAKNFISNYTGIPVTSTDTDAETLDSYADFVIVALILCQDMYDNRTMYIEKGAVNMVVKTILDMHTRNNI